MAKKKVQFGRKTGQKAVSVGDLINCVIKHHRNGGTMTSVAAELGVTPAAVSLRMKYLRDHGVKGLPTFDKRGGNTGAKVVEQARAALKSLGIKG